jgi:hypothetical protein
MEDDQGQRLLVGSYHECNMLALTVNSAKEVVQDLSDTAKQLHDVKKDSRFSHGDGRSDVMMSRLSRLKLNRNIIMSDYDILTKYCGATEEEAQEMVSRMKIQKLTDLKLQIMAQNPTGLFCVEPPEKIELPEETE